MLTNIYNSVRKDIIKREDIKYILNIIYTNRKVNYTTRLIIFEILIIVLRKDKLKTFIITPVLINLLIRYILTAEEKEIIILYKLLFLIENKSKDKIPFQYEIFNALIKIREKNILLISSAEIKIIEIFESLIFNYHLNERIFEFYFLPILFEKQFFKYEELIYRLLYLFYLKSENKTEYLAIIMKNFNRISCQNQIIIFTSFVKIQENLPIKIFSPLFIKIIFSAFQTENISLIEKIYLEIKNKKIINLVKRNEKLLFLIYEKSRDCLFTEKKFLYLNIFNQLIENDYIGFKKYYFENHEKYKHRRTGKILH